MNDVVICFILTILNFITVICGCLLVIKAGNLINDIMNYSSKILGIAEKKQEKE